MACPHAETTTLLWLYGEGSEAHAQHVAECVDCTAAVATHEQVVSAVGPGLASLASPAEPQTRRRRIAWIAVPLAVAALALVWLRPTPPVPLDGALVADTDVAAVPVPQAPDPFDLALDDLALELDRLSLDLGIL